MDYDTVYRFGKQVDLLTFEIENVNVDALERLESEGVRVFPTPQSLRIIQDKGFVATSPNQNSTFSPLGNKLSDSAEANSL